MVDSRGEIVKIYPGTEQAINYLRKAKIPTSVISSTMEIVGVQEVIRLYGWEKYFKNLQLFPGKKKTHLKR